MKLNRVLYSTISILSLAGLVACSMAGISFGKPTPTPTPTPVPSSTPTPVPTATLTNTPRPSATPQPTRTPNLAATKEYEDVQAYIQTLYKQGYLPSTDGKYSKLDDFSDEWAQIGWYRESPTGYSPVDFVLRADMKWESAVTSPNPSGCGIVFHRQPNDDHYLVFVSSFGYVLFYANVSNDVKYLADKYFGPSTPNGSVNFALIVKGTQYRVLINGKSVGAAVGYDGRLLDGELAYTIVSGTNAGFGTRCEMTNIILWEFTP